MVNGALEDRTVSVKVRGIQPKNIIPLLFINNPPEGVSKEELKAGLEQIGSLETKIADHKFGEGIPLCSGKTNGRWKLYITVLREQELEDSITVKGTKIGLHWPRRNNRTKSSKLTINNKTEGKSSEESKEERKQAY